MNAELKETEEALVASQQASNALDICLDSLSKARDWGTLDMLGGGLITTAIKRGHMDDAQSQMDDAHYYVQRLKRELQDLNDDVGVPVDVNPGGFLHFADYFFDDFFVDWAVQDQIKRATDEVYNQYDSVTKLTNALEARVQSLKRQRDALVEEKKHLVEGA